MRPATIAVLAVVLFLACGPSKQTPAQHIEKALTLNDIKAVEAELYFVPGGTPGLEKAEEHLAALKEAKLPEVAPYIDATLLPSKKPAEIVKELQDSGRWREVKLLDQGTRIRAENSDTHFLEVYYEGEKLLLLKLALPEPVKGAYRYWLPLVGIREPGVPMSTHYEAKTQDAKVEAWSFLFSEPPKQATVISRGPKPPTPGGWVGIRIRIYFEFDGVVDEKVPKD
jgi:hypothetical protein